MQTPTPASQATRARKPKAPAIPALMPTPLPSAVPSGIFWAINAQNDDACVLALEAIDKALYKDSLSSSTTHTKQIAMIKAIRDMEAERNTAFRTCQERGGLLFAWRGSRALVQALPSSLRGAT